MEIGIPKIISLSCCAVVTFLVAVFLFQESIVANPLGIVNVPKFFGGCFASFQMYLNIHTIFTSD